MKLKLVALLGVLAVGWIIVAADLGHLPFWLRRLFDFPQGDRIGHLVIYGALAFVLTVGFTRDLHWGRFRLPVAIVALLLCATVEEYSQALFVSRTADWVDLGCTWVGIGLGGLAAGRWQRA